MAPSFYVGHSEDRKELTMPMIGEQINLQPPNFQV